jgi:hypothetical protein
MQQFDAWLDSSTGADALRPASEEALRDWLRPPDEADRVRR